MAVRGVKELTVTIKACLGICITAFLLVPTVGVAAEPSVQRPRAVRDVSSGFYNLVCPRMFVCENGRILGSEEICRELGIDVGIVFNDRLDTAGFKKLGFDTIEAADIECGKRNVKFVSDYLAAGGKPERMVFQSWMTHPTIAGPETVGHTFLGITKRQLDAVERTMEESE